MSKTFKQFGRLTFGKGPLLNFSFPISLLQVEESALILSCLFKRWTVPKSAILQLSKHRYFSDGLRIAHNDEHAPRYIVFWTIRFEELKRELQNCGYVVS